MSTPHHSFTVPVFLLLLLATGMVQAAEPKEPESAVVQGEEAEAKDLSKKPTTEPTSEEAGSVSAKTADKRATPDLKIPSRITLNRFVELVLALSPDLKSIELDYRIAKLQILRERGEWQPYFELLAESESNTRENNVEQSLSQLSSSFIEDNETYTAGVAGKLTSGAEYRVGYSLADLSNNLFNPEKSRDSDPYVSEYVTFAGFNISQPLLKNFGKTASKSDILVAETRMKIAFESVRRQRMLSISRAQVSFLDAFKAQEAVKVRIRSLEISKSLLKDVAEHKKVGKASALDVDTASAGVQVRHISLLDARRVQFETMQALLDLVQKRVDGKVYTLVEPDLPEKTDSKELKKDYSAGLDRHPDLTIRRHELKVSELRLGLSENQKLPELNLIGSFGYNGLGESMSDSMDKLQGGEYDSWSVGLLLRVPIGKNKDEANQYKQAVLGYDKSVMGLKDARVQIENTLYTAIERLVVYHDYYEAQTRIVTIGKTRLDTQRKLADAGKSSTDVVLEAEEELADSEAKLIDVRTRYLRAEIQLELSSGEILSRYNAEFSE